MSNKRIKKKHNPFGSKKAGLFHCRAEIGSDIIRKCEKAGIKFNKRAVWSYTHWLSQHSSERYWNYRVIEAYYPKQPFLSAKHLLQCARGKSRIIK